MLGCGVFRKILSTARLQSARRMILSRLPETLIHREASERPPNDPVPAPMKVYGTEQVASEAESWLCCQESDIQVRPTLPK